MSVFFKAIVPFAYFIVTMAVMIPNVLAIAFGGGTSFFKEADEITSELGHVYGYTSAVAFGFIVVVTAIQIALVEFRINQWARDIEERKIWIRMFMSGFALLLPPVALWGVNLRLSAQEPTWAGFKSDGSLMYVLSAVFLIFAVWIWHEVAQQFRLQE